jgi:hypothetical protein
MRAFILLVLFIVAVAELFPLKGVPPGNLCGPIFLSTEFAMDPAEFEKERQFHGMAVELWGDSQGSQNSIMNPYDHTISIVADTYVWKDNRTLFITREVFDKLQLIDLGVCEHTSVHER